MQPPCLAVQCGRVQTAVQASRAYLEVRPVRLPLLLSPRFPALEQGVPDRQLQSQSWRRARWMAPEEAQS